MSSRSPLGRRAVAAVISAIVSSTVAACAGVALPQVEGPLTDSGTKGIRVWQVGELGYEAQEYLISGKADVDRPVSMADAKDMSLRNSADDFAKRSSYQAEVLESAQPYTTRMVVYRPKDPHKFSGNVAMEVVHPGGGGSLPVWSKINGFFVQHGDAYVTVQHPLTFDGLQKADAGRYGSLHAADPTQIWGMVADAGTLLRSSAAANPLQGYEVRHLYLTGYSYTGVATSTFADYHHGSARLANGNPIFDGYLSFANAMYVRPLDVPVIRVNTQSEFNSYGGLNNRGRNSDTAGARYRLYEVAGASHVLDAMPDIEPGAGAPAPVSVARAQGLPNVSPNRCMSSFPAGLQEDDLPLPYVLAQAFANMYDWVDNGIAPPETPWIKTDSQGNAVLDANGNAEGGLRLPEMAAPAATYGIGSGPCLLFGYRAPFEAARMKELYGSTDAYLAAIRDAADRDVAQRLISAEDARRLQSIVQSRGTF